jgi:pimeloyl-ACP methyl ester carboxylesterase
MWIHQVPAFAGAGYRVLAYDRRGHGRTADRTADRDKRMPPRICID